MLSSQVLDKLNILLLSVGGAQVLELGPLVVLCLALLKADKSASVAAALRVASCSDRRGSKTYLEVEGAGLGGVLELGVLGALLEQSVELEDKRHS